MQQFETDLIDAFRLIPTLLTVNLVEPLFREHYKHLLNGRFIGLMPSEDTPREREATKDMDWPPDNILHLIEKTGARTMGEFLSRIKPTLEKHLDKQVFVLLTTAFDGFLERNSIDGTLGRRFSKLRNAKVVPPDLDNDMQEIIQRRNDIAHGGVVTQHYISADKYPGLLQSTWVKLHGVPLNTGIPHVFDLNYLYEATSVMYRLARLF